MRPRALLVDDDEDFSSLIAAYLDGEVEITTVTRAEDALEQLGDESYRALITDVRLPGMGGFELVRRVRETRPQLPVIVVTGYGDERCAVDAMKLGAVDYFGKPPSELDIRRAILGALRRSELSRENERLAGELNLSRSLVFTSPAMSRLALMVHRVAPKNVTVLIGGESGTGKEKIAEAIVRGSPRATKPFVRFSCAAINAQLADAELFGHTKGAFTDARDPRRGLFREADGGTLLLDEIGELDPSTQAKLLRVLQEGEVRPVGSDRTEKVDVRVIASTNRNLRGEVEAGRFREDLFYRLQVVHLTVPPLRDRPDDIPVLVKHFVSYYGERFGLRPVHIASEMMERLCTYTWPGNVRELKHVVENMLALSQDGNIDLSLLPDATPFATRSAPPPKQATLKQKTQAYERGIILAVLREARGNRTRAARLLGVSRATLHEKLRKHQIDAERDPWTGAVAGSSDKPPVH